MAEAPSLAPLPCCRCHAAPTEPRPERPILVVDDDAKIVRLVRTYLEREGYRVVTAADGPAALDAIETHRAGPRRARPDAPRARRSGRHPGGPPRRQATPPIIILSARGSTIDRIAGLEDGADDYLPKPFSPAELVLRVKSILRRATRGDRDPADDRTDRAASPARGRSSATPTSSLDPERHEVRRTAGRSP